MLKAFKYRLYPTEKQVVLLNKHFGSMRFVYNLALETKQAAWTGNRVNLSCFDLMKQLTDLKKECEWLSEVGSQSLQQVLRNLDNAFTRFFKGQGEFPTFKKKTSRGSFNIPQGVSIKNGKLVIRKFGEGIEIVLHRPLMGEIRQATISKTPTGKYFASILCETGEAAKPKALIAENTTAGIDMGINTYLVTSDGKEFENPKFLRKAQSKLKFTQRKYSKHKGKRTKQRLAILHEKVANQRKDFLHKTSSEIIKNHDSLAIEDLSVSNMVKNHNLSQSISDASWGTFVSMLEYKAGWYGKNILKIGRFDPSSKICSSCGKHKGDLKLSERSWICACGVTHDRDLNAAINIKNFALKNHLSAEHRLKNRDELPTLVGVMTSEAHRKNG